MFIKSMLFWLNWFLLKILGFVSASEVLFSCLYKIFSCLPTVLFWKFFDFSRELHSQIGDLGLNLNNGSKSKCVSTYVFSCCVVSLVVRSSAPPLLTFLFPKNCPENN